MANKLWLTANSHGPGTGPARLSGISAVIRHHGINHKPIQPQWPPSLARDQASLKATAN